MALANRGFSSLTYKDWKIKYYEDEFGTDAYAEYIPDENVCIHRKNCLLPVSEYVLSVSHCYSFYASEISAFSYDSFEEDVATVKARTILEAIDLLANR